MNEYRCPYCGSPLDDTDVTGDGEALRCPDCDERVEFADVLGDTHWAVEVVERRGKCQVKE